MTGCVTDVRRLSRKMVNSAMLSIAWQVARCELFHAQLASFPWTVGGPARPSKLRRQHRVSFILPLACVLAVLSGLVPVIAFLTDPLD